MRQAWTRNECYDHQEMIEKFLYEALNDHKKDLWQVISAYTVYAPQYEKPYRLMIVLFPYSHDYFQYYGLTTPDDAALVAENVIEYDLTKHPAASDILCTSRKQHPPAYPTIDYIYIPTKRWYCVHNKYHN